MTWDFSRRSGGLHGEGGLVWSRGRTWFLCVVGLCRSGGVGAEVGQRQGDGSHVVDSEQDLQGVYLLEALICQGLAGPLNLFYTRREGTHPTSCGGIQRERQVVDQQSFTKINPYFLLGQSSSF